MSPEATLEAKKNVFHAPAARRLPAPRSFELPRGPEKASPASVHDFDRLPVNAPPVAGNCPMSLASPRACPFGGACHTCPARVQARLAVNRPGDMYEQEADRIADAVTRGPDVPVVQRKCSSCVDDDEDELQRKEPSGQTPAPGLPPGASGEIRAVLQSPGRDIEPGPRALMESHFGQDFRGVRIHTDTSAAESAQAVNALAYTVGQDIVFASGQYAPGTPAGQGLLAHELAHTVQQRGQAGVLQRRLRVDDLPPTDLPAGDPTASLTAAQRYTMVDSLVRSLCSHFRVDMGTGYVNDPGATPPSTLATGSNRTGCCGLNILATGSGDDWVIELSQLMGPHTRFGTRQVYLQPEDTPFELGSFTSADQVTIQPQGRAIVGGHELVGHAALRQILAHPIGGERTTTDVHDPTVRIENRIAEEQGVTNPADLRGLASPGAHRGESLTRMLIRNFAFNVSDPPSGELGRIQTAAQFIIQNDSFVDVVGHSDNVGSDKAKQDISDNRARKVKDALLGHSMDPSIDKHGVVDQRIKTIGKSDREPPPAPYTQDDMRRVEIFMAGFPAGSQTARPGTPTARDPHPRSPFLPFLRYWPNACIRHLVREAYP